MPTLNERSSIITVSSGAGAFLVGSWVELITSAARDSTWSMLYMTPPLPFSTALEIYIDLSIGPISSEVIILNDALLQIGAIFDYNDSFQVLGLPLRFQAGDRIAARIKDESGSSFAYNVMLRNFE